VVVIANPTEALLPPGRIVRVRPFDSTHAVRELRAVRVAAKERAGGRPRRARGPPGPYNAAPGTVERGQDLRPVVFWAPRRESWRVANQQAGQKLGCGGLIAVLVVLGLIVNAFSGHKKSSSRSASVAAAYAPKADIVMVRGTNSDSSCTEADERPGSMS
jgi:hypothetical protein